MFVGAEYHLRMRSSFPLALFTALLVTVLSNTVIAQGPPASLTSQGFGGHFSPNPGVPASVTSPGFGKNTPNDNHRFFFTQPPFRSPRPGNGGHRGNRSQNFFGSSVYAVPYYVPYYVGEPVDDTMEQMQPPAQPEQQYLGGPTIFDRRGPGVPYRDGYAAERAPAKEEPEAAVPAPRSEQVPAADQPETLLVFKDGHKVGVQNYAILGDTLYDMTPGHSRKVVIADLDLEATVKENDQRGIDFRLPLHPKEN
jgi:hypothetical protein